MTLIDRLFRLSHHVTKALVLIAGAAIIATAFAIAVDILLRKTTSIFIPGTDEIGGYVFAATTAIAFSFTLLENANVRIDALTRLTPSSLRSLMEIVGLLVLGLFVLTVTWRGSVLLADSFAYDSRSITPLNTPLVLPQAIWLIGLVLYCINLLITTLLLLRHWTDRSNLPQVFQSKSSDELALERDLVVARTQEGS